MAGNWVNKSPPRILSPCPCPRPPSFLLSHSPLRYSIRWKKLHRYQELTQLAHTPAANAARVKTRHENSVFLHAQELSRGRLRDESIISHKRKRYDDDGELLALQRPAKAPRRQKR